MAALLLGLCQWAAAADFIYTMQPGDHPWNLAQRYLQTPAQALQLRRLNKIPDDRHMLPGTRLRIPIQWLKLETAQVRLLAATGEAEWLESPGAPAQAAVPAQTLQAPAVLRTGATGSISLQFADGSRVLMGRDSALRLQQTQHRPLGAASLISLLLLRGTLENQVTPLRESGGRFEIRTPAAVAAVRGTAFRVHAERGVDGEAMRTEVLTGAVGVANPQGEVMARAAQGSVALAGQSPSTPVPLLPPPRLDGLPEQIERLPIDLPISPSPGASGYRTQIAPDIPFGVAISDETSSAPRVRARLLDLEDGAYRLRVRAIDGHGLEGLSAERAIVVHARPEPPLLIEPAPDAVTTTARPAFRWTQADLSRRYRVQISAQASPEPFEDQTTTVAAVQPDRDLPPGLYQWRVATIDPVRGQGPWGDAQAFRRVLPGPGVEMAPPQHGMLTLRWTAQPQAVTYRIQLSRDSAFASPLIDAQTDTPQFLLEGLQPGVHHVRVQAIAADGDVGPWGDAQTFTASEPEPSPWRALWLLIPALAIF